MDVNEGQPEVQETVVPAPSPEATVLSGIGVSRQEFSQITGGRYELKDEIGRGGMGTVLRGRDPVLNRDLAIKFLRCNKSGSPDVVDRFLKEAQISGQLQHPGIVPIYELGKLNQQVPFIAMKLVDGDTMQTLLRQRKSPNEDQSRFLGIFEQVCLTMAYAHSRNVIHRDLKPSNIMVGAFGEVQVMDWGIAKVIDENQVENEYHPQEHPVAKTTTRKIKTGDSSTNRETNSHTSLGTIIGTPGYMPPEQAQGATALLDKQSDVFGLGAILCVILTGKPPFVGASRKAICQETAQGNISPAIERLSSCEAEKELVNLAARCLSCEKKNRPADAGEVAEELASYFRSVRERLRQSELDKTKSIEEKKRRRITIGLAGSMFTTLLIGAAAWIWIQSQQTEIDQANLVAANVEIKRQKELTKLEKDANERETKLREKAQKAKHKAEILLTDVYTSRGLDAGEDEDQTSAIMWFGSAAMTAHQVDSKRETLCQLRASNWLQQAIIPIGAIKVEKPLGMNFQPLGNSLLVRFAKHIEKIGNVECFTIFDWQTGSTKSWLKAQGNHGYACWSPDGTRVAMTSGERLIEIRNANSGDILERIETTERISRLAFDAAGNRLAVAANDIKIWNLSKQAFEPFLLKGKREIHSLEFNQSGNRLVIATRDNRAFVYSIPKPSETQKPSVVKADFEFPHLAKHGPKSGVIYGPAWDVSQPDRLLAISGDNQVSFWDVPTKKQTHNLSTQVKSIGKIEASPCGNWFAIGGFGGPQIRSIKDPEKVVMNLNHRNYAGTLTFGRSGSSLVTGSLDNTTQFCPVPIIKDAFPDANLIDEATRQERRSLNHDSGVCDVAMSDSEKWLATTTVNGLIRIWKFPAPWNRRGMQRSEDGMRPVVSPCHRYVIAGKFDGVWPSDNWTTNQVQIYLAKSGFPIAQPMSVPGKIHDTSFDIDGKRILLASSESAKGQLSVWDVGTGGTFVRSIELAGIPHRISNSPGKNEIAVLDQSNQLELVNLDESQSKFVTKISSTKHKYRPRIKWLPDGKRILVISGNAFSLVDATTGTLLLDAIEFENKLDEIPSVAVTPDSRFVAVGAMDWVKFWDLETGKQAFQTLSHPRTSPIMGAVADMNFDPSGKHLVTASLDKRARIWNWETGELACPPLNHEDEVLSSIFSPDGRFVITGSRGERCGPHFWDCYLGKKIAPSCKTDARRKSQAVYDLALSKFGDKKGIYFLFSMGNVAADHDQFQIFQHDIRFFDDNSNLKTDELVSFGELATSKTVVSGEPDTLAGQKWYSNWLEFHERQPEFGLQPESRDFMWHIMRIVKLMQFQKHQFAIDEIDRFNTVVDATPDFPELNRNVLHCLNEVNRAEILKAGERFKEMNATLDRLYPRIELLATKYHDDLFAMDAMGAMVSGMHAFRRSNGFSQEQIELGRNLDQLKLFGRSKLAAAMLVEGRLSLAAELHEKDLLKERDESRKLLLGSLIHQRLGNAETSRKKLAKAIASISSKATCDTLREVILIVLSESLRGESLASQKNLKNEILWAKELQELGNELFDLSLARTQSAIATKDVRSAKSTKPTNSKR